MKNKFEEYVVSILVLMDLKNIWGKYLDEYLAYLLGFVQEANALYNLKRRKYCLC
jgi:hypothetical protein